jgi:hypothetical protein
LFPLSSGRGIFGGNMIKTEYLLSGGKVYEVIGKDGQGNPVTKLTTLTEIPKDEPLNKVEDAPKRRRKKE